MEQVSQDEVKVVSCDCSGSCSLILLSIEIEVLDTGNLNCGKWLEALLDDVFLAVINLFGGLSMLSFLLFICERSFQQLKMDGMASGFNLERLLNAWYSIS